MFLYNLSLLSFSRRFLLFRGGVGGSLKTVIILIGQCSKYCSGRPYTWWNGDFCPDRVFVRRLYFVLTWLIGFLALLLALIFVGVFFFLQWPRNGMLCGIILEAWYQRGPIFEKRSVSVSIFVGSQLIFVQSPSRQPPASRDPVVSGPKLSFSMVQVI